jgi:hypothetical protein
VKVVILTSGEYDSYAIHGVFSDEAKAEEFAELAKVQDAEYEEWDLDPVRVWKQIFSVWIDLDGNLKTTHHERSELLHPDAEWKEVQTQSTGFYAQSSISEVQALTFAQAERETWLKEFPDAEFYHGGSFGRKKWNRGDRWHFCKYWHKAGEIPGFAGRPFMNGEASLAKEGDADTYIAFARTAAEVYQLINDKRKGPSEPKSMNVVRSESSPEDEALQKAKA